MAVDIDADADTGALSAGTPHELFEAEIVTRIPGGRPYDVSSDGRHVLVNERAGASGDEPGAGDPSIAVVLNWDAELGE